MTREEAMHRLQELANEQGTRIYTESEADSLDNQFLLVAREKKIPDDFGPFSPLGRASFEVEVQMPHQPQNPDEMEQLGVCYQHLAAIHRALGKEQDLAFDTTPDRKAEYERKHDLLFNQMGSSGDKVEQAVHEAAVKYVLDHTYPRFGFEAAHFHEALALAAAKADGFQHKDLPAKILETCDPYLVTTEEGIGITEMAELMRDRMLCSEQDKKDRDAHRHDYDLVYSSDVGSLIDMNLQYMESYTRADVYDFLVRRDNAVLADQYEMGESPESYEALEDLFHRLKEKDLLLGEVPDFAPLSYSSLYTATCRINTNIPAVQDVIKEWHRDWVREDSFGDGYDYHAFCGSLRDDAKMDFINTLSYEDDPSGSEHSDMSYVLLNMDGIDNPGPYNDQEENVYLLQNYPKSLCRNLQAMLGKNGDFDIRYALDNPIPFQISNGEGENLILIPERQFTRVMEEHPELKEAIEDNCLADLPQDNAFMGFWQSHIHEVSALTVSGQLMKELNHDMLSDEKEKLLLDTILNYPVETIHKRVSSGMKETWWPGPFEDAVYAKRQVIESKPEFQALCREYDAYRENPEASEILRKLVGPNKEHAEALQMLHEKAKSLQK